MTISVNEQVAGHKVIVRPAPPAGSGRRSASCECGWRSQTGRTEQVMPEIRTHLDSAVRAKIARQATGDAQSRLAALTLARAHCRPAAPHSGQHGRLAPSGEWRGRAERCASRD
jgi:hypothetical protein